MAKGGRGAAVAAYVVLLGLAAVAIAVALPLTPVTEDNLLVLASLGLLVAAAEFLQVRFRFGRQVDGTNLVEAAIAPLLVVAPGLTALLVVVLGQTVAATVRRNRPMKAGFNIAQWSLATAVGSAVWLAVPEPDVTTWTGAGSLLLAVASVSIVNLLAFTGVMVIVNRESPVTVLRRVAPVFGGSWLPGLVVNALLGLLFAVAHAAAPASVLLFPVPLIVLHLAFSGYAEARADRARLVGMQRAIRVLTDPLDPRQAIAEFLREAAGCFETRAASLVLRVEGGRQVHTVDTETGEVTVRTEVEDEATLEGALTAQLGPVRIVASGDGPLARALFAAGRRDCLAAPMLDGGKVLGALLLLDQHGVEGRKEGELTVLEALAREAAGAFSKGRLLDSVLEERRKLATVVGATSDGIAALGEDGIVRSWNPALEVITGLSERVVVGRLDALARLDARTPEGDPVDLSDWASGATLPEELSVRSQSGGRRRLFCSYSHADDEGGRALVLVARDVTPVQEFEALRAEFGRLVAQEAARRLVVEQLQAAVVPDRPDIEGLDLAVAYVASDPKEPTGGDLWDWHVMPNGELHIAVVDVLGHGVAATKSALAVVHTLRAIALDDTPLETMVERASTLLERSDSDLVATVVLARLDPRTGRLRVASGGHPPALIMSADGRVRQITATGGAIGWPGAGSDSVEEVVLAPGDGLLLYTDGLVEARKDILQGLESLARETASVAHLPVSELADELVSRALAGADRRDDTLALVVRRTAVADRLPSEPPPSGRWQIRPDRHAAQQARREAVRWLDDRGVPAGDAALVIAELLANAVRAARGVVVLELSTSLGRVHIAVSDDGPGLEELPADTLPPLDAEGSRGLFLVRKLSRGLELDGGAVGTTVRCWLPTSDADDVVLPGQPRRDVVG
jgi:serine phosphatase RsbU (regulator of sigma subunit)/anti-sigma regulatory factor (Ser/Thr protein kinase)/GAF domain-containing protein